MPINITAGNINDILHQLSSARAPARDIFEDAISSVQAQLALTSIADDDATDSEKLASEGVDNPALIFWVGALWLGIHRHYDFNSLDAFLEHFKAPPVTAQHETTRIVERYILGYTFWHIRRLLRLWGSDFHAVITERGLKLPLSPGHKLVEKLAQIANSGGGTGLGSHLSIADFVTQFGAFVRLEQSPHEHTVTFLQLRAFLEDKNTPAVSPPHNRLRKRPPRPPAPARPNPKKARKTQDTPVIEDTPFEDIPVERPRYETFPQTPQNSTHEPVSPSLRRSSDTSRHSYSHQNPFLGDHDTEGAGDLSLLGGAEEDQSSSFELPFSDVEDERERLQASPFPMAGTQCASRSGLSAAAVDAARQSSHSSSFASFHQRLDVLHADVVSALSNNQSAVLALDPVRKYIQDTWALQTLTALDEAICDRETQVQAVHHIRQEFAKLVESGHRLRVADAFSINTTILNNKVEACKTEKKAIEKARSKLARAEEDCTRTNRLLKEAEELLEKERKAWTNAFVVFNHHACGGMLKPTWLENNE